jgi:spermidine synthase
MRVLAVTFIAATALGSALLFLVEPLIVRMILPLLGGSPAVWNTAMVFFQSALLTGYLLAHLARRGLPWSSRPWIQIGFVAVGLAVLPVAIPTGWEPPSGGQALWVLAALAVALGVPFVALAMLSPTLQGWFADTSHPRRQDPYFLYAAGNVGSVVGLLSYPLLVEPFIGLRIQSRFWTFGYGVLVVLLIASALLRRRYPFQQDSRATKPVTSNADTASGTDNASTSWRTRGAWILMAAIPSGLLLAVTQHISSDVASIPLLWVIPLTIYLATFVIAFSKPTKGCPPILGRAALLLVLFVVVTLPLAFLSSVWLAAGLVVNLAAFGLVTLAIHFELAGRRPPARRLTEYYLWIAVGGLLGGVGVALVAPVVFDSIAEYPLLLLAALGLLWWAPFATKAANTRYPAFIGGATVLIVAMLGLLGTTRSAPLLLAVAAGGGATYIAFQYRPRFFIVTLAAIIPAIMMLVSLQPTLHQSRSFFGVLRVTESDNRHVLVNGSTVHGSQQFVPVISDEPTNYYMRDSGVGRLIQVLTANAPQRRIAVVGLGTGTLATYGRDSDHFEFFEIDQSVVDIARSPEYFTFLSDTPSTLSINIVDGRIGLADSAGGFDLVVLDAFNSDAIPIHLLTREAIAIYRDRLSPDGVVAVHISNRHFDLGPVVARATEDVGMQTHMLQTPESIWLVLSNTENLDPAIIEELADWTLLPASSSTPLWTDDYANVLASLRGF